MLLLRSSKQNDHAHLSSLQKKKVSSFSECSCYQYHWSPSVFDAMGVSFTESDLLSRREATSRRPHPPLADAVSLSLSEPSETSITQLPKSKIGCVIICLRTKLCTNAWLNLLQASQRCSSNQFLDGFESQDDLTIESSLTGSPEIPWVPMLTRGIGLVPYARPYS